MLNIRIAPWSGLSKVPAGCGDEQKDKKQPLFPDHASSSNPCIRARPDVKPVTGVRPILSRSASSIQIDTAGIRTPCEEQGQRLIQIAGFIEDRTAGRCRCKYRQ